MVADHLSRNYLNETTEKLVDEFSVNALSYLPITPWKYVKLQKAAAADLKMMLLRKTILEGWQDRRDELPNEIRIYWNYRDELACIDGFTPSDTTSLLQGGVTVEDLDLTPYHEESIAQNKKHDVERATQNPGSPRPEKTKEIIIKPRPSIQPFWNQDSWNQK